MTAIATPTTTTCVICLQSIPADGKHLHYCTPRGEGGKVLSREWVGFFEGDPINYGADQLAVLAALDHFVSDLLQHTAADTADMLADAVEQAYTCVGAFSPDIPCDAPVAVAGEFCDRCKTVLDRIATEALAQPPNLFDSFCTAYGWACVELEARDEMPDCIDTSEPPITGLVLSDDPVICQEQLSADRAFIAAVSL